MNWSKKMTDKKHMHKPIDFDNITEQIVNKYGIEVQTYIWMEECGELAQAFSKMIRKGDYKSKENLIEEIADVCICMNQAMYAYGITDADLWEMMCNKNKRNYERLLKDETK